MGRGQSRFQWDDKVFALPSDFNEITFNLRFTKFPSSALPQPNPHRTTQHTPGETAADESKLSCPGNRVVTDTSDERLCTDVTDLLPVPE